MDQQTQTRRNRLLELLGEAALNQLQLRLDHVTLEYKRPLYEAGKPIQFIYFPLSGVASLVSVMADGLPPR